MKKIVAIACGMDQPKKNNNIISKRNLYLNYGLLGLCTLLNDKGYKIEQFQGEYLTPEELINIINNTEYNLKEIKFPVLISIVSFLSIDWCYKLTKILKMEYGLKCIVGGKYVVDGNVEWLKNKLPYVDLFIEGSGEKKIEKALNSTRCDLNNECLDYYKKLDYSLVYDYKKYNPCIEIARGCGRGCVFCADGKRKRSAIKNAKNVIEELHYIEKIYNYEPFNVYFQMATFQVSNEWIRILENHVGEFENKINWRCTSRIDTIETKMLPRLSKVGLKVIDLGLESASPIQLILMNKTNEPQKYLKKAEEILRVAYECGIWVKLNILLTAGETKKTIEETQTWLNKNKKYIKGISANCETIYGPYNSLIDNCFTLGSTMVKKNLLDEKGFSYINLSDEIDFQLAKEYCVDISKSVMNADDYFDLKKYGYFSRYYDRTHFYYDLDKVKNQELPFTIDTKRTK